MANPNAHELGSLVRDCLRHLVDGEGALYASFSVRDGSGYTLVDSYGEPSAERLSKSRGAARGFRTLRSSGDRQLLIAIFPNEAFEQANHERIDTIARGVREVFTKPLEQRARKLRRQRAHSGSSGSLRWS